MYVYIYPSLDIDFTVDCVCELFLSSDVDIDGINYKELSLYLSLNKDDQQLRDIGMDQYCPKRRSNRGRRPNITGCGTTESDDDRHRPWVFPDISGMDYQTKKRMVAEALRIVLVTVLRSHTYEFAGQIKRQSRGGPIGMELTGVVAQVFMVWWDRQFKERLRRINKQLKIHERYVDDSNVVTKGVEKGTRYDGEKLVVSEETFHEDEGIPADKRTMLLLQQIASYIHPSIRLTTDYPSNNADGKVPMLDAKMWFALVNARRQILYEHYEKPMCTKAVINAKSALPIQTKRTVLTQEMLRILLHCSDHLPWENVCTHLNNFMKKLQFSGYSQPFRYNVAKSALHALETIKEKDRLGVRPVNRLKTWRRPERAARKLEKRKGWYKEGGFDSVLFVPSTPNSRLKRSYQKEIAQSGLRIKVVERSGITLQSKLQVSNPFKPQRCGRDDCFVCSSGGTGNCNTEGITYEVKCLGDCGEKDLYKGESARNAFTRGYKHITDLNRRNVSNSPLWKHCRDTHGSVVQDFQMKVTGTYRNDAMLRQISEAVQIENTDPQRLMNTRAEWNMTRVPRATVS